MKFTQKAIEALRLPPGKDEYVAWDDALPGFGARVRASSTAWRIQYRTSTGKQRSESLGDIRKVDLESARKIARQRFAMVELGKDPGHERDAARQAATEAGFTVGKAVDEYLEWKRDRVRPNTFRSAQRHLLKHWQPLHKAPINAVTENQINDLLAVLAKTHGKMAAHSARKDLAAMFTWAMRRKGVQRNPAAFAEDPAGRIRTARAGFVRH